MQENQKEDKKPTKENLFLQFQALISQFKDLPWWQQGLIFLGAAIGSAIFVDMRVGGIIAAAGVVFLTRKAILEALYFLFGEKTTQIGLFLIGRALIVGASAFLADLTWKLISWNWSFWLYVPTALIAIALLNAALRKRGGKMSSTPVVRLWNWGIIGFYGTFGEENVKKVLFYAQRGLLALSAGFIFYFSSGFFSVFLGFFVLNSAFRERGGKFETSPISKARRWVISEWKNWREKEE